MSDPNVSARDASEHHRALPQVRLIRRNDKVLVAPTGESNAAPAFEPFALPKLPKCITDHIALFCERIQREHARCVGAVLLMDRKTKEWTIRLPVQRCGRTSSCWSALERDVPELTEDLFLAGSYQLRQLEPGEEPVDAPPPHDGVHFVHVIGPKTQSIWTFLRAEGQTHRIPADVVIFDDMAAAIEEALPRLRMSP